MSLHPSQLAVFVLAFLLGFRHGIDWDHIAAISDVTGTTDHRQEAFFLGILYIIGHALVVIILGIAAIRKDRMIAVYSLPMAAIGGLIATFHYGQQVWPTLSKLGSCDALGGVSCSIQYTQGYGYITIPLMALTGFIAIGILVFLKRKN